MFIQLRSPCRNEMRRARALVDVLLLEDQITLMPLNPKFTSAALTKKKSPSGNLIFQKMNIVFTYTIHTELFFVLYFTEKNIYIKQTGNKCTTGIICQDYKLEINAIYIYMTSTLST